MNIDEWRRLATAVNADIGGMSRATQTRTDVRAILQRRQHVPTEEQFIDTDAFDSRLGQPRTFRIADVEVKVWKTHRLGLDLSDVKGADLYYELGERKFILIQYKIPSSSDRVNLDEQQLQDLQNACPVPCPPTQRFGCGGWYALAKSTTETMYFPACEAFRHFGAYKSRKSEYFINGLTKPQFQTDFSLCRIGARTEIIDLDLYEESALANDRVFIHAQNVSDGLNAI